MYAKWCFFVAAACLSDSVRGKPLLELTNGKIEGRVLTSRDGRPYHSYTGLPYAKPPVGELRFKAPEPVGPWSGTLDATKEPEICIQRPLNAGQEDCLYLNVYSPATGQNQTALPVMFWIHGGAFSWGHSRSDRVGPDYFMDKNVVLVTINYRLGVFGFLSTEDDVIPGNFGLKDQAMALRWVRENVAAFNGDPGRVTIFGGSSGAYCVGLHMMSPSSKGLFHKAVLQSGAPVSPAAVHPVGLARKRAHSVATLAGCSFNSSEDVLKCLRRVPAKYLTDIHSKSTLWLNLPFSIFKPVVESCASGQEAFLCHHPIYDFKQESFVPAIFGLNEDEGGLYVTFLYNETSLIHSEFKSDFNYLFSVVAGYNYYAKLERIDEIGEKVLKKYFPSGEIVDNTQLEASKMFTDAVFTRGVFDMINRLSSPVYGYYYDYKNEFSFKKMFGSGGKRLGAVHSDELVSLFKMKSVNPNGLNEKDVKFSKLVVDIWYKFAASNDPTIDGQENGLVWPKFTQLNQSMLHLNSTRPSLIRNPFIDGYAFWNELPIYEDQFSKKTTDRK